MSINPLFLTDFYKQNHAELYNPNTTKVYSTWTPRGSRVNGVNEVVVFGIQYFIKKYLIEDFNKNFFSKDQDQVVSEYKRLMSNTIGNTGIGEKRIRDLHNLGYLPIKICALDEGTLCPVRVPMLTIENTLDDFFWVTNFLETLICNTLWMPTTSATTSFRYRKILDDWANKTCDDNSHVDYQAHDFSLRSLTCMEAGAVSGMAHLLSFVGTDTIPAIVELEKYYNCDIEKEIVGTSVRATEHSIQETNILSANYDNLEDGEYQNLKSLLERVGENCILSYVADTYNQWDLITKILPKLKEQILSRSGKLVIRGDSGDPVDIICGYNTSKWFDDYRGVIKNCKPLTEKDSIYYDSINKGIVELLWDIFGGTVNSKGYKVLNPCVGAIYGDSITIERANEICERLAEKGFASSNVVLGVGGYSFQYVTRDTYCFALKSTYAEVNNKGILIYKDPITDSGIKKSAKGMVAVVKKDNTLELIDNLFPEDKYNLQTVDLLQPVFENGKLLKETSLKDIRGKLKHYNNTKLALT